jgi:Ca2+/H+ antiporter
VLTLVLLPLLSSCTALVLLLSVMHAAHMINDAESHWLEGLQLIVTYFM